MINRIKKIFNTKDKKALLENFVSLSALQLIGMLLPLISLPYILRVIGFEKYGVIVFSASLIAYFTALTDFSFRITATRDVALNRDSPKKLNIIYSKVLTIKTLFLLLSWLLIAIAVFFYPPFWENKEIYFYTSLLLLGYVLFPEWFFQGIEKMRYITYLNLGIKLFFTLCVFIFIKKESDFWIYPLLQSAGYIGAGLVGQYVLVKKYKLKFILLPYKTIVKSIKVNSPIFINQFVPTLYNNTSTFVLGILGTAKLVGIYQAILTVVNLIVTLIEILSRVFFPFLNRRKDAFQWYKKMMLITISVMILGVLVFNKLIFWYLNVSYDNAFWILLILSAGLFGYTLYNIFGLNYFIVNRQDKLVMKNTLIFSLLGFFITIPMIKYFTIFGSAISLSLVRCLIGFNLFFKWLKNDNKQNL
ncbi:polysaccharide transporter, PST family [Chryseobacterium soldanellicola]|uniref:Polysaccharide transporter, PST family n=1 Tax=Chryseobacterium soldanellicola TaxID=311333 RepID=A0A1H0XMK8_9FLAO|nr:oligosaccharide flippase family protein [Chryseobacterium soldanellicola]SDQ04180.1 polysaccharide transporter, PST family [Chryseobacterium soldanellicola]